MECFVCVTVGISQAVLPPLPPFTMYRPRKNRIYLGIKRHDNF